MRRNNRTAAKVFTFLLCLTLLAGCSDSNGGNSGNGNDTQVTVTAEPGKEENNTGDKDNTGDNNSQDTGNNNSNTDDNSSQNNTVTPTDTENNGNTDNNQNGTDNNTGDVNVPKSATFKNISIDYKNKDIETSYVPGDCTSIVFSEGNVNVVGKDTEISNVNGRQIVKIIKKGDYLISGSCSNGQIIVEANKEKDVRLILNGLTLSCSDSAPIYEQQCDKMVITLADGTENVLSSDSEYIYDNVEKKQPDAVIFAKDDLVINGNGKLAVESSYMEGIHSTDSVKLISGNITVNSGDTGVRGKEAVIIKEANLNVTSKGDGIKTTYSDNTSLGYVIIEGGNIKVYTAKDGIQATGHIQITGGKLDITTDNGVAHAGSDEDSKSAKGIKGDNDIYIKADEITVNSCDDAINANGNVIIDGGTINLSAMDDALNADGNIVVNNGGLVVHNAQDGISGMSVSVNGGSVAVESQDDGIKASAGKDEDADDKVIFGAADPFAVSESVYVAITGGNVYVKTDADCIDSDGNLYITGGTTRLEGEKAKTDGGVSYKGTVYQTGGSIEAEGLGDISQVIINSKE